MAMIHSGLFILALSSFSNFGLLVRQRASLLPFFLIYLVFLVYPVLAAFRLSFYESSGFGGDTFTGLDNYARLVQDSRYLEALKNTTLYALASVFILSPLALLVAVAIRSFVVPTATFKSFYRIIFFLPFITSFVVIALMFNLVFNNEYGLLNNGLSALGSPTLDWLRDERVALLAIILSICSEADAFVAASLTDFSPTAQLAFMVVGPMVDLKLIALQAGVFGWRFAVRFAPICLVVGLLSTFLIGALIF
jgi:hypothetical protein